MNRAIDAQSRKPAPAAPRPDPVAPVTRTLPPLPPVADALPPLPDGLPEWITPDVVADTLRTFRPFYGPDLTLDDALGMLIQVGNLFAVLSGEPHEPSRAAESLVIPPEQPALAQRSARERRARNARRAA